jgi:hypothetical protein
MGISNLDPVRMRVDLGMLEVWWVPSGHLSHATYGQFVSFSMNIDECPIERFSILRSTASCGVATS